jgi:predicted ATPase/class 3 adenylate cyclase
MMQVVPRDLPSGTVTFLFTDVEGSTKLLHELGAEAYARALAEHRRVIREAVEAHDGVEVDTQGDALFVAFPTAPGALSAAAEAHAALAAGPIRVRMGLHSGTPLVTAEGYVGEDVHRAARIAASGHGGQTLVSASTAALVGTEQLRDLGPHRLKDLSAQERIFQFGDEDFPPLKSLHQTNLPVASTPFIGRERELPEVVRLLSQDDVRLLTLTGPGGTGKTRLAMQTAAFLSDRYPQGTWWVPLAALRESELVLETAAQVVGAKDGLAEYIGDRSMLLLFDNFEQVVDAATDVAELLTACPNLELLVTSRESLRITGEHEYAVPPLVHEEGVGFFIARARAAVPGFDPDESVSEICRRLDDLPLALELAAARVKALTTRQILKRLEQRLPLLTGGARDLPERQRTLRATIEWSYELLSADERTLFGRLGVFRGGCTLDAAETVADAELDTLQSLVDKSLLRRTGERYWMLETIREFAADHVEEEICRRHAEYFLALAEEAEPHLPPYEREWVDRLEREHDNLREALDWLEAKLETQLLQRLSGALARFWLIRGHGREGGERLERTLAADNAQTPARLKALNGAALLPEAPAHYAREALSLAEALGDTAGAAQARLGLATVAARDDMPAARMLYEEAAELFRRLGDDHMLMVTIRGLAWACMSLGDVDRGRTLHEENLQRARALGNTRIEGITLGALSTLYIDEGRLDVAWPMLVESHRLHEGLNDPLQTGFDLFRFAMFLTAAGAAQAAATVLATAEARSAEAGANLMNWDSAVGETLAKQREQLGEDAFTEAWERGRALTAEQAFELALQHGGFAE